MQTTYILYNNHGGVVGPLLEKEIPKFANKYFENKDHMVLEEDLFKLKFPQIYYERMNAFWIDHVAAKLMSLPFVGPITIDLEKQVVKNQYFHLHRCSHMALHFNYSTNADRSYIMNVFFELAEYMKNVLIVHLGEQFYVSPKNGRTYVDEKADIRQIAENTKFTYN